MGKASEWIRCLDYLSDDCRSQPASGPDAEELRGLFMAVAKSPAYRSAVVDELTLDDDFCRRPLRPEDLNFIDFSRPVTADTAPSLSALASKRVLLFAPQTPRLLPPPHLR